MHTHAPLHKTTHTFTKQRTTPGKKPSIQALGVVEAKEYEKEPMLVLYWLFFVMYAKIITITL